VALCIAPALHGCASAPPQPVLEQLDERTGVTINRLARPLELVAASVRSAGADPFAALAPFETNVMGRRTRWLWIAFPGDAESPSPPHRVIVDGTPLSLPAAGADPGSVSLKEFPYAPAAPWNAVRIFALDATATARLASAREVGITVEYPEGRVTFSATVGAPSPLAEFAARTLEPR
jgi:hypothetical protein